MAEVILDCFFDKVLSDLDRDGLRARYKRRSLVDQLNTVMEGCIRGELCDKHGASRTAVLCAIRYHDKHRAHNGHVCRMGKYHNVLYVAAKVSFDWQLQDTATVACLLDSMFLCEHSFERLLVGAVFGPTAPHVFAGWKSDYRDREENVRALVYFLAHAATAGLEYRVPDSSSAVRFVDVPLEVCGQCTPVHLVLALGTPDTLHLLLRFGAAVPEDAQASGLEALCERLHAYDRVYPFHLVACLKLVLRVVVTVRVCPATGDAGEGNAQRDEFLARFPHLTADHLVPASRCGATPPELKHLCRCTVRHRLWHNHQLPDGIRQLPVPESLQRYLDLFSD